MSPPRQIIGVNKEEGEDGVFFLKSPACVCTQGKDFFFRLDRLVFERMIQVANTGTSVAFDLAPGPHRRRCWHSTCRRSGSETTRGALVPVVRLAQTRGRSPLGRALFGRKPTPVPPM